MAFLEINPSYQDLLQRHGLREAAQLVSLPGLVVSGHPDRHVVRVQIGGRDGVAAYLKREHRVRWPTRLANAWAGQGLVSNSIREARTLAALRRAGVGCPEWMAAGEDDQGRAFLLIADLPGTLDLREFLRNHLSDLAAVRHRFACHLGVALARLHAAGFDHPDLYAKHVLVAKDTQEIYFIDWQRTTWRRHANWSRRIRDLAALDATLAQERASSTERLACLGAYLGSEGPGKGNLHHLARDIRKHAERLLRKGHVRKERDLPPPVPGQGLLWLDGEALCVSQDFWTELGGQVPPWLPLPSENSLVRGTTQTRVALADQRQGLLVRSRCDRPLAWLWSRLRCRSLVSRELRQAGLFFGRRKHGLTAPRVLAFGQRRSWPWRTESFLLTEIDHVEGGPQG